MTKDKLMTKVEAQRIWKDSSDAIEGMVALGLLELKEEEKVSQNCILDIITKENGKLKAYEFSNGAYEVWYHGRKVWSNELK